MKTRLPNPRPQPAVPLLDIDARWRCARNEEKMSKSLGNFVTLDQLFDEFHPEVIRFFLLQSHYRSAISFSDDGLIQAETAYSRLVEPFQTN